jgi:hypothetical protein
LATKGDDKKADFRWDFDAKQDDKKANHRWDFATNGDDKKVDFRWDFDAKEDEEKANHRWDFATKADDKKADFRWDFDAKEDEGKSNHSGILPQKEIMRKLIIDGTLVNFLHFTWVVLIRKVRWLKPCLFPMAKLLPCTFSLFFGKWIQIGRLKVRKRRG